MTSKSSPSAELIMELRSLVCRVANDQAGLHATQSAVTGDWDLDNLARSEDLRAEDCLAVLRAAQLVVAAVEATTRTVTTRALRDGADFAQIGAAEGISRQAARQRHRRHSAQRLVRLVGGPRDGKHASAFGATREIRHGEAAGPWDEDREVTEVTSVYRTKYGSPEVFEFHHYEDLNGNTMTE